MCEESYSTINATFPFLHPRLLLILSHVTHNLLKTSHMLSESSGQSTEHYLVALPLQLATSEAICLPDQLLSLGDASKIHLEDSR